MGEYCVLIYISFEYLWLGLEREMFVDQLLKFLVQVRGNMRSCALVVYV